ncbi:uncharacterized protein LOC124256972 isoform X1 [Haliotis rubra]|uniref:uncharacterized protein LOC124256972 isoform X1 n=1 Tax=Haliotis rubra TaxID=36100 RepID=UPI001EE5B4C3|nr:uncharacterized protein LOC124256972 isoform X1 [Haliotis rubra]
MTYLVLILVVQIFVNTSMQHPSLSVAGSRLSACYGHTGLATSVPGRQVTRRTKMASARIMLPVVVVGAITTLPIGTIAGTSLNMTQTPPLAFLGLSLQFKCHLKTNTTSGALLFHRNTFNKCSVERGDCTQYASDRKSKTKYSCGCGQQDDGNYVYILNASSLHDDVVGDWRCEHYGFSNIIHVNLTEPEGPTQIQLGKTEPPTTDVDVVNLTCSANCLPDCRYSWTKSGQDLTSQTRGSRGQVLELRKQDSGYYTCTAVNLLSNHTNSISYVQNVPPSHDPVAADAGLSMFGFGVGAGVAGSVVVVIIVSCLVLRKYRRMKRAVDFPYASTQQLPNAGMEHSHYQELPTPQLVDGGYSLADGDRAEVFTRKVDTKETDGTNTITATNPVYDLIHDDRVLPK